MCVRKPPSIEPPALGLGLCPSLDPSLDISRSSLSPSNFSLSNLSPSPSLGLCRYSHLLGLVSMVSGVSSDDLGHGGAQASARAPALDSPHAVLARTPGADARWRWQQRRQPWEREWREW